MTTTLTPKVRLEFAEISRRVHELRLPEVDVVGIGRGGLVPASLIAHQLEFPPQIMRLNDRDDDHKPRTASPRLLEQSEFNCFRTWDEITSRFAFQHRPAQRSLVILNKEVVSSWLLSQRVLLVDDVSVTGKTLNVAADFVLFPEVSSCVIWPWSAQ